MRRRVLVRSAVGFLLSGLVLGGLLRAVRVDQIRAELAGAEPALVAAGAVAALLAVACWSEAQRQVLSVTSGEVGGVRFRLAYLTGDFTKQVLPMGHVSGPAIMAYAIGSAFDVEYGDALAAITVSDLLNLLVSVALAGVGTAGLLALGRSSFLGTVALALGVAGAGVLLLAALVFSRRRTLTWLVVGVASRLHALAVRVVPGRADTVTPDRLGRNVRDYYATLDSVTADRRAVASAGGLALVGWVLYTLPLYASALALDVRLGLALALFVVPVAGLATWFPLPGGLGGVELAVAAALVGVGEVTASEAAAVALLYRLCNYWTVVAVGGLAAAVFLRGGADRRALRSR